MMSANNVELNDVYNQPLETGIPEAVEIVEDSCDSDVIPVILPYPNLVVFLEQADDQNPPDKTKQQATHKPEHIVDNECPKMYVKCSSTVSGKRVFDKKHYYNLALLSANEANFNVQYIGQLDQKWDRIHHYSAVPAAIWSRYYITVTL